MIANHRPLDNALAYVEPSADCYYYRRSSACGNNCVSLTKKNKCKQSEIQAETLHESAPLRLREQLAEWAPACAIFPIRPARVAAVKQKGVRSDTGKRKAAQEVCATKTVFDVAKGVLFSDERPLELWPWVGGWVGG